MAAHRYAEIYSLATRFDFVIVEDDAYFYQQHVVRGTAVAAAATEEDVPGLRLGPSFLSVDTGGRVLRLDSFSKWLAPGFRLGWVSGAQPLVAKYAALAYASSQNGCSLSIMLLGRTLQAWSEKGLETHLRKLQAVLRSRCRTLVDAAVHHMGDGAEIFHRPQAGMFVWVRLAHSPEEADVLVSLMKEHGVAVLPGDACSAAKPRADGKPQSPYVRLSFVLPEDAYPEALRRLGGLVKALL
eukprot:gnl/TRDRNA2_/TRDRNA2_178024_c2_seq2.p1 gnl/TRDRNA2_/TRDRNA2_178024_c2~~gnl/TRDRNA2_/TRDRNA2_178024_c2_seq2.p1  ORF type:complete len:241 (+),score=40.26 gnl/TRDRNA2_/TRDRNA2_178024_c2_seq2:474-1196(+)